jgi:hypothetical protein
MKRILKAIPAALLAVATLLPTAALSVTDIVPDKTVAPAPGSSQAPKAAVRDRSDQARPQPQGNGTQEARKPESNAVREPKK